MKRRVSDTVMIHSFGRAFIAETVWHTVRVSGALRSYI